MLLALALEQGDAFAARAAVGTLLALAGVVAFMLVLAAVSARRGAAATLAAGWAVFLAVAMLTSEVEVGAPAAAVWAAAWLVVGGVLLPRAEAPAARRRMPAWDLPLRAAAAATLVLLVTALAEAAGARLSGALALSPVAITVLTGFSLASQGRPATLVLLRGLIVGLPAVLCFFTIAALTMEAWGAAASLTTALLVAVGLQAAVAVATGPGGAAAVTATPPGTGESHPTHSA